MSTTTAAAPVPPDRDGTAAPLTAAQNAGGSGGWNPSGRKRRILVADDNEDSATTLGMLLNLSGNEVRVVHDGIEAIHETKTFLPDVIFLDIGMPGLSGYDTARQIRAEPWGKHPLLVALTGWGEEEDKRRAKEAGFDLHLVKPVDPAALEELLSGPHG